MSIVLVPAAEATDDEIRDACVNIFSQMPGLSADPATRDAYDAIIAPDEIEGRGSSLQQAMDAAWSCAETTDGGDRLLLDDAPPEEKAKIAFLWQRYVIGNAMIDEQRIANAFGARRARNQLAIAVGACPKRGDHVIIDASGVAHTFTLISDRDPVTGAFKTVEGGTQTKGWMSISAGERVLRLDGVVTSLDGKAQHSLYCWIDIVVLARAAKTKVAIWRGEKVSPNAGIESAPT